jgi:ABC-type bacteriocin/lantibiotic exporter with double-glycine peptidase domain
LNGHLVKCKYGWRLLLLSALSLLSVNRDTCTADDSLSVIPKYRDANDCGRIAAYLFANLSKTVGMEHFVDSLSIREYGVTLQDIHRALRKEGIRARLSFLSPSRLGDVMLPAIVHLQYGYDKTHFTVVVGYDSENDVVSFIDHDHGVMFTQKGKEFRKRMTGYLIDTPPRSNNVLLYLVIFTAIAVLFVWKASNGRWFSPLAFVRR